MTVRRLRREASDNRAGQGRSRSAGFWATKKGRTHGPAKERTDWKRKEGDIHERAWGGHQCIGGLPFSRAV